MTTATFNEPPGIIPRLTLAWVRLYSTGMRSEARETRRIEIESDLWEHFADRSAEGASPASTNTEMLGRLLRGMPSDIAWRFQAEGLNLNIHFPVERLAGLLLLLLIIPLIVAPNIFGRDTRSEYWSDTFTEFSEESETSHTVTAMLHAVMGLAAITAGALFASSLRERAPRLGTVGGSLIGAAGVLMLVGAGLYSGLSGMAEDYAARPDESMLTASRALAKALEALQLFILSSLVTGALVLGFALVREGMAPRWTAALAVVPLVGIVGAIGTAGLETDAGWLFMIVAWLGMALWMLVTGGWLLFGGSRAVKLPAAPAPAV